MADLYNGWDPNSPQAKQHFQRIKSTSQALIKDRGHYDPVYHIAKVPTLKLNGEEYPVAGHFFPGDNTMHIYPYAITDPDHLEDVLSHELGHHRYNALVNHANKVKHITKEDIGYKLWEHHLTKGYDQLAKTGNVSPYAEKYWTGLKNREANITPGLALNETHSEVSSLHRKAEKMANTEIMKNMQAGFSRPSPETRSQLAYDLLQAHYGVSKPWADFHRAVADWHGYHRYMQAQHVLKQAGLATSTRIKR